MPWEIQAKLVSDLARLKEYGVALNLLLNATCYGSQSLSKSLLATVAGVIDYLSENFGLESVTTTSPIIAEFIKANYSEIETRASVNMDIGKIQGMDYLAYCFDAYYLQRDLNRNFEEIDKIKNWCDTNGKKLLLLANSGCLNHCSAHNFHDNLVSHESEISKMDNAVDFTPICRRYIKDEKRRVSLIRDTNYIRPEDLYFYERWFKSAKLATRANKNPDRILMSYINGTFNGNILDLLEPDYAGEIYPQVLRNKRFPEDFYKVVGTCDKKCALCDYCDNIYHTVLDLIQV
jgi:hypothetical protein